MNILSREKQIEIIAALCEGVGMRATARLAGVDRKTVARLALQVGRGCAELHDRRVVGVRVARLELDEIWSFVGKKQKRVMPHEAIAKGDQYVFVALAGTQKAIISYRIGKRDVANTDDFIQDLRGRVLGSPEISTDGYHRLAAHFADAVESAAVRADRAVWPYAGFNPRDSGSFVLEDAGRNNRIGHDTVFLLINQRYQADLGL